MSFFKKLFGAKSKAAPAAPQRPDSAPQDGMITAYDAYGRQIHITREQWRDNVLLGNLEKCKNAPDDLYSMIASALKDGFVLETVPYAEHLRRTDPDPVRGAVLLAVVYLELNRLDDAERLLLDCSREHGESGYVLSNLAKVYSKRGQTARADQALWRALQLDPNQDMAVGWYWAEARQRDGDEAGQAALRKIAALQGSWRAQLWLARAALDAKQPADASRLYDLALANASRPVPADLLGQLTGDLGNHGLLVELLRLATPHYDPAFHGMQVGNNLIKANVDLGRLDHARQLVEQLYAQKRPDYRDLLGFWDSEIAKANVARENESPTPLGGIQMLRLEGPVWLPSSSPAVGLFPGAVKDPDAVAVCLLGASVAAEQSSQEQGKAALLQLSDTAGRLSRALPLYLAEHLFMQTTAQAVVLQPWIVPGGFAIAGWPWDAEVAIDQAKSGQPPGDYVVLLHLQLTGKAPAAQWRLLRCIDGSALDSGSAPLDVARPEACFAGLAAAVESAVCSHTAAVCVPRPAVYQPPVGPDFDHYQLRLEQLLSVRVAVMPNTRPGFLFGVREIVGGNIHLCLANPKNVTTRILLFETLRRLSKVHPQIVQEFRTQLESLTREHPLPEPASAAIEKLLGESFANASASS
jgi:tetratricopeptide (TPR) repeat protein